MEQQIKVSIITACYNSEKTIRGTIEAVLNQSYKNIEYIVIDGKSKDNTLSVVKEYESKFNGRIKIVSEKDAGIYDALNKGIAMATGELVCFANSDDWFELDAVEKAVQTHQQAPEAFIYGIVRYIQDGKVLMISTGSHEFLPNSLLPYPTWFVPRVLFQKFGPFSVKYKIGSDVDLVLRFFKNKVNFRRIDAVLANFRTGGASDKHIWLSRIEVLESMCDLGYISKNKLFVNVCLLKWSMFTQKVYKFIRSVVVKIIRYDSV